MEIIKLNLIPNGVNPTCHCSQYDNGRVIRIDLFDGLTPYVLQSGDTVTLNVRKPDNTIVTTTLTTTQGNKYVDLVTTKQICAVVGYNLCDLTITNGETVIGTLNFIMQVERDVLADGIPSQSVIEDLEALVQEAVGDQYYTKTETDTLLDAKADKSTTYTKTEVDAALKANNDEFYSLIDRVGVAIDWEQGRLTTTGADTPSTYTIRSKNYIVVNENDDFYLDIPYNAKFGVCFYDNNKTYISRQADLKSNFVVPSGAAFMRVVFLYNTTTNIDISESRNVRLYRVKSDTGEIINALHYPFNIQNWAANTAYLVGEIVKDSGLTYICKTAHTSGESFDSAKFSQTTISKRADIIKPRLKIDYMSATPDTTKAGGTIYYNITLHSLQLQYGVGIAYTEAIPYYPEAVYIYEGIEYIWDAVNCVLVPKDQDYQLLIGVIPDYKSAGYGIKANGDPIATSAYNISQPIELNKGDKITFRGYVSSSYTAIAETDAANGYFIPLIIGEGDSVYTYTATKHTFIALTCYSESKYNLYSKKPITTSINPVFVMKGFFNKYGSIQGISTSVPNYKISNPIKLYAGDKITIDCYAVINDPILLEYQDRWNTYWANTLGNANILILPDFSGRKTYTCIIPKTSYYVFCCNVLDENTPKVYLTRTPSSVNEISTIETNERDSYAIENHNYVDTYDFAPDLVNKRTNAILTYSGDNKKEDNFIVNAVAYPNGEIIACRAGGDVVKIANDGTETVLLNIPNAQDWRGMFIDTNLNVYVSPHSSTFSPSVSATDRGLYKLAYGANSFVKVINLCRSTTEITEWAANTAYAVGDKIMRDNQSDFYICKTAHTSGSTFDVTYWNAINNWAANTAYAVGDLIIYNSCYYRCVTAHTSGSRIEMPKFSAATEFMYNDDTIWTLCEDEKGFIYAGVYSHSARANPAIYRSTDGGSYFVYQHNFIMNGTLPESVYGYNAVRHVHCVNYNNYDGCLYAAVGEVNTIVKSKDYGATWEDLHVASYYGQPTYILGVKDGLVIGSDGHYSCGVSKLMSDGKTIKLCGRTAAGFIFNIRRSDLTGWLYAWTRIDNIVAEITRCPPYEAINDPEVLQNWIDNAPESTLRFWTLYNEWASKYYPEDAIRPQNAVILVSKDEGDTWEVINKVKVSQNNASICGYITVGYFRDGECLAGLLKPIENTESGKAFIKPVIISEGKKKRTSDGFDLTGEIFIKTNTSNIIPFD